MALVGSEGRKGDYVGEGGKELNCDRLKLSFLYIRVLFD